MSTNDLFVEFLLEAEENIQEAYKALDVLFSNPSDDEALKRTLRVFHTLKGGFGMFQMTSAQNALHELETEVEKQKSAQGLTKDFFIWIQEQLPSFENLIAEGRAHKAPSDWPVQLTPRKVSGSNDLASELDQLTAEVDAIFAPVEPPVPAPEATAPVAVVAPPPATPTVHQPQDSHVRVALSRIDQVLGSVWEIFMTRNQLSYMIDLSRPMIQQDPILMRAWEALDSSLRRTIGELESQVMEMRMVPISGIFERMARVVQQFTHTHDKKIKFITEGEDLEVDKRIVDSLADPLIHLVRNAMDHGVETPSVRQQVGKDPCGKITLKAQVQGTEVLISITDDGKGMDPQLLRKKALEKGLHYVESWSDQEILNVIFEPGFSTAETISEISGRGVGMDVVRSHLNALSGSIDVQSKAGQGSTFQIRIPLSVSVINCLVCEVNNMSYAIPNSEILEAFTVPYTALKVNGPDRYYVFRDQPLKLIDLTKNFPNSEDTDLKVLKKNIPLLIVEGPGQKRTALIVNRISHNQEIVSKPPPALSLHVPFVSGVSILANGKPIFVLSAPKMINHFLSLQSRRTKDVSVA